MGRAGRGVGRNARRVSSKTRRVWRRGVELAYEPTETSDPFARQLKQHDSPSHQNQVEPPVRQQSTPSLPPRRISNGVSAPRLASRARPVSPTEPPFGGIAEDDFIAPQFAEAHHPTRAVNNSQQPPESSSMKRASPFFALNDLVNNTVRPIEPVENPPVEPLIEAAAPTPKAKELRAVPGNDAAPRIEIVDAPPPPSVVEEASASITGPVSINRSDDELTPQEALEAQAQASAQAQIDEPIMPVARKPKRAGRPRRRFGDGPLMPDYFDEAVRALDPPVHMDHSGAEEDIQHGVQNVTETLASFKIDARVTDVKRGPVITRYEVQPAPGVRVAAIANLDRDLARSLSAIAVRIEAPVPGKNVVGIEVPNKKVNLVRLRDVLELPEFLSSHSKLSFVLGKDIAGQPKWGDLTKMPHMLIAGATNSGKSVCLNAIITSIISRAAPDEVKFSLIDPKRVELTLYRDIPHLYHPVVVEPKEAVRALRGMITEMDRRYKKFAERGVRNIASYNSKLEEGEDPLPYIVIVIDELADLMMTAAAEFEKLICRLAQLARATGIHLIVATQRPSVNVITGVIKANIPARIAFAVASQVDSRTILDSVGAERLIGSGDMLFDANNGGKAVRIQGAYLSEEECNRIVQVVKAAYSNEELEYGLDLSAIEDEESSGGSEKIPSDEKRDELYDQIKEFVLRHDEMSASNIQRKFEIGYPRAGRIVDQLERDGILGPADGPKARKVLGSGQ
jgi:S-DNA-T family DNA segregation ATPase FtsK/SpoIIIE